MILSEKAGIMKDRKYYRARFQKYPDVVTVIQFREMLGGIGDKSARKIIHANHVKHYYINTTFFIPKESVIDYVLSTDYAIYRNKLKSRI